MNSTDSIPRPCGAYGKNKQISERNIDGSNSSTEASIISQHKMGSWNLGKSSQGKSV
jgi:hypothetical protein